MKNGHRDRLLATAYRQNGQFSIEVDGRHYPVRSKGELLKEARRYHNNGFDFHYRGLPPDVAADITRIVKR